MSVKLTLYTRADCGLCGEMKSVIEEVARQVPVELEEIDIDMDSDLRQRFGEEVPVLFVDGRKAFKYQVAPQDLLRRLGVGQKSFLGFRRGKR